MKSIPWLKCPRLHRLLVLGKLNELVKAWVVKVSTDKVRIIQFDSSTLNVFFALVHFPVSTQLC